MTALTRLEARAKIMQAANRHRLTTARRTGMPLPLLSMRHVQQAVFSCRQNVLVDAGVLEAAGYRARRRRP